MEAHSVSHLADIDSRQMLASMRRIDWREWSLWLSALAVTIVLALGIASFTLPAILAGIDTFSSFFLGRAVRGLWGLVLLLDIYVIYEQRQINRIRRDWAAQLYILSVVDPLTGLFNRRYIEQRLESEIARSQRDHGPLTVILFDLDGFKLVNDRRGHGVGDEVLKAFADRLKKATRGSDVASRYGGDEFLLLLPDCKADLVPYVLKRLQDVRLEKDGWDLPIGYSAGWTDYAPGESAADLLKRADAVLYANKRRPREPRATGDALE